MIKICKNCGNEFEKTVKNRVYCSPKCNVEFMNIKRKTLRPVSNCKNCNKKLSHTDKRQKFCNNSCYLSFLKNKPKRMCEVCGNKTKTRRSKYCIEHSYFSNKLEQVCKCIKCGRQYVYERSKNHTLKKCNTCVNKAYRNNKMQKVYDLVGKKCSICGYDKCLAALEFHHTNPLEKEYTIAQISNRNIEFIKTELEKCILVCGNCHRELHENDTGIYTVLTKQQMKAKENYELRKQFIMSYKVECKMCGYNKLKSALEFHHKNPEEKLFVISTGHFRNIESIKSEIEKCDVLCVNCHRNMHN